MGRRSRNAQGAGRGGVKDGKPETRLVAAGRRKEWTQGIVNPAVWRASTILFDSVAAMKAANPPADGILHYGRNGTPTTWALCEALTEMEPGAAMTRLYPSGSAAVAGALLAVLGQGDELLMVDSAYGPTRALCDGLLKRFGITTIYYDPLIGGGIAALIGDKTRAIFMESPGTHTFEVQDVPAICAAAKARGLVTLLDNTWATPLFFRAMAAGVDLSILACTKYVGGHADAMLGSVTATEALADRLEKARRVLGQTAGPDDAWLILRGLRTLDVRLRRHQESGLRVARWLKEQPQVARVLHPALEDCPGHELWARDFTGATGLFSFVLDGGGEAARTRLIDSLERFGIGYSWGAFESLAVPADPVRSAGKADFGGRLVRLHIGLEDPGDLIEDLAAGLARCGAQA
ncbi:MAG: cysteine-S-conjugate beta-lyase [Sphingomonadales bacterium]|jgi:cystathionine beta-lyase|nr:cysteine-S-conjugate beta-lyase [Sphingomonadales bacterium]MEA3045489.1 cysteine-S-conjugate beta-lyase [Sphingomonadales bacterium]